MVPPSSLLPLWLQAHVVTLLCEECEEFREAIIKHTSRESKQQTGLADLFWNAVELRGFWASGIRPPPKVMQCVPAASLRVVREQLTHTYGRRAQAVSAQ